MPPDCRGRSICRSESSLPLSLRIRTLADSKAQWRVSIFLLLLGLVGVSGCHRQNTAAEITVAHEITPVPARVGLITLTFTVSNASARPESGARIRIEADMTHAGMSPVLAEAKEIQPGRYQSQLTLQMAGDWVILLHGTLASGEKLERQFDLPGVRAAE
jgi:hypothetical protein